MIRTFDQLVNAFKCMYAFQNSVLKDQNSNGRQEGYGPTHSQPKQVFAGIDTVLLNTDFIS